jgi:Uncharacterized protein conserved in bacteria
MDEQVINKIIDLYKKEEFQTKLEKQRNDIESELDNFIKRLSNEPNYNKKIKEKVVSRIKTSDSLSEKLKRKNYFSEEIVNSSPSEALNLLKSKIRDLIGFRINCYFKEDEKVIFKELESYLIDKSFQVDIDQDPQKNGHPIFKMHCSKEKLDFNFEIQVKSLLHDVWGEVEHKIIYKAREYDSRLAFKKQLIESLWKIIEGTDEQLIKIFESRGDEQKTKKELFYIITSKKKDDEKLAQHYDNFFMLTERVSGFIDDLDKYIGHYLLKDEINFKPKDIKKDLHESTDTIKKNIDVYKLEKVCEIAKNIYDFDKSDQFISFLLNEIFSKIENDSLSDEEYGDDFNDELSNEEENKERDMLVPFACILLEEKVEEINNSVGKE